MIQSFKKRGIIDIGIAIGLGSTVVFGLVTLVYSNLVKETEAASYTANEAQRTANEAKTDIGVIKNDVSWIKSALQNKGFSVASTTTQN